jgi:glutamate---cysteine ligase / carboxylate-amine ligase
VEDAVVLAGLVRGLVETAARQWRAGELAPDLPTEVLRLAGWRAARSGLAGDLVDPRTGRPAPAADVLHALVDHVRPALLAAGDDRRVRDGVAEVLVRGNGAALQRRLYAETGDLAEVVRAAVSATHGS